MAKDRKTGLGAAVFFQPTEDAARAAEPPDTGTPAPQDRPERSPSLPKQAAPPAMTSKVRTTVLLYPETLAGMDVLKIRARRNGEKATYSDILEQAIRMLMEKHHVEV